MNKELDNDYNRLISDISSLLEQAQRAVVRSTNSVMTVTYWKVGRRIVEFEQHGASRAEYGRALMERLARDLTSRHGRGFSLQGIYKMRAFYLSWQISPTPSGKLEAQAILPTVSGKSGARKPRTLTMNTGQALTSVPVAIVHGQVSADMFPLSWSKYVRLISVENLQARSFYESEALRGGWSVRQLDRQISTQFYERAMHSKRPQTLLAHGSASQKGDALPVESEIRDPYLLEFLNLKDEYSESDLEEALIRHLEAFLLELGNGFTFVARQKRIRVGDEWYRIDLLLFHRRLKCLVVIDLKIGKFTHSDAGQMNLYLNYVREHLMEPEENEPVGLILCSAKDNAVAHYAMGGIKAKVFTSRYLTVLPDPATLRQEILTTQQAIRRLKEKTHG